MKTRLNFISIVVLGNFNPAILTPNFLKETCKVNLGEHQGWVSPPVGPKIVSQISYDNIELLIDFDRFQITERNVNKPDKIQATAVLKKYLSKLQHTPLVAAGINFNFSFLSNEDKSIDFERLYVAKPRDFLSLVGAEEIILEKKETLGKRFRKPQNVIISFSIKGNRKGALSFRFEKNELHLNYNYELSNLQQEPKEFLILVDEYSEILSRFVRLRNALAKKVKK